MTSLEAFYQSDLLPDLEKLEAQRLVVKKKLIQAIGIFVALNLIFLFTSGKFGLGLISLLIFLVISGIFTFFPWHLKYYRGYHAGFKATIIPRIVAFVDQRLQYDKTGMVPKENFIASHLFQDFPGEYGGDDLVSGTLGETAVQFSEIHAKRVDIIRQSTGSDRSTRRTKKKVTPIFRGLFFVADFNKAFKGTTVVLPDTAQKLFGDLGQALQALNVPNGELVKMEDPEFEKLFVVYGEDQVEARFILSTSLMRRIVDFRTRTRKEMRLSFSASKLHVAIPFEKELFEPKIMESLLNIAHIQAYYDDLKLAIDIVDDLNLNTRIWTQRNPAAAGSVAAANAALAEAAPAAQTAPPTFSDPARPKRYSEDETKTLFREFVHKADTAMAPKIKTAKRWLKRIAGIFLLLLGGVILLMDAVLAGLIILGFGIFFLIGGFAAPTPEKLAGTVIFPAIGIVIALFSYNAYSTRMASNAWPTVGGVIVKSEIETHDHSTSSDGNQKSEAVQYPKIAYDYQIDGQNYKGTRISFSSSSVNAQQLISRYPQGKPVQVYYNPDKPRQAVLVPGGGGFNIVPYIFSTVFVLLGIFSATRLRK